MSVFELSWTPENRFKVFLLTPHSPPPSVCEDPGCHPVAGPGYRVTARARQRRPPSAPLAWLTNECGWRLDQSQPSTAARDLPPANHGPARAQPSSRGSNGAADFPVSCCLVRSSSSSSLAVCRVSRGCSAMFCVSPPTGVPLNLMCCGILAFWPYVHIL